MNRSNISIFDIKKKNIYRSGLRQLVYWKYIISWVSLVFQFRITWLTRLYIVPVNLDVFISIWSTLFMVEPSRMVHLMQDYTLIVTVWTEIQILHSTISTNWRNTSEKWISIVLNFETQNPLKYKKKSKANEEHL